MKKRAEIHKYFIGLKKGLESWLKYMVYVFYAMYLCLNIFSKKILEKKNGEIIETQFSVQ